MLKNQEHGVVEWKVIRNSKVLTLRMCFGSLESRAFEMLV